MSETIEGLRNKFLKWKEAFESMGLQTKVIVSSGIKEDGSSQSKVDPSGVSSLRAKTNSVLCAQCGKWIRSGCVGVKRVTQMFSKHFICIKCEGNIW